MKTTKAVVVAAFIFNSVVNAAIFKKNRTLPEEESSAPKYICDKRCGRSCYFYVKQTIPMEWTGADEACGKHGSHLANIYTTFCFHAIRHYLVSEDIRGEILIGMTYQQDPSGNSDRVNLYKSDKTVRNPLWYRRRPNRVGEQEMVMIVGKNLRYSGIRNTLNKFSHKKVLCEFLK